MDRKQEAALDTLSKKFNCAQSVFSAFAGDVGIDREIALKVSACFGGGMKCGEVCGAATGALMAIGMKCGSCKENDSDGKLTAYKKAMEFMKRFKEKNGSLLCRDLLGYDTADPVEMQKAMQKGLHETVCKKVIAAAVEIAEDLI